jgi:hypothetical protein
MNCSQKKIVRSSNKEITMANMKKPAMKKPTVSRAPSKTPKTPMPKIGKKPAPLTGPAAVEALQRRTSPSGVKKAEAGAKKAIDKKYPGLYKKSK